MRFGSPFSLLATCVLSQDPPIAMRYISQVSKVLEVVRMMQTVTTNEQIVALSVSRWGDLQRECGTKKGTRSLGGAQ